MTSLYLTEPGVVLRQENEHLILELPDKKSKRSVPLDKVTKVMVFGRAHISGGTITALLERKIPTAFFSSSGRIKGVLSPLPGGDSELKVKQVQSHLDHSFYLAISKKIVKAKISGQKAFLMRLQRRCWLKLSDEALKILNSLNVDRISSINELFGLEGKASAIYFSQFGKSFLPGWTFLNRNRRPPKDPINAMLSLGYSLLTNEAAGFLAAHGLDPSIGFYHRLEYGRPSLALDVIEEFRVPAVDRFVLRLTNLKIIKPEHFQNRGNEGVWLSDSSRKTYFISYEKYLEKSGLRKALRKQILHLVEVVCNRTEYHPFTFRG